MDGKIIRIDINLGLIREAKRRIDQRKALELTDERWRQYKKHTIDAIMKSLAEDLFGKHSDDGEEEYETPPNEFIT